jgi:hypothetical protein
VVAIPASGALIVGRWLEALRKREASKALETEPDRTSQGETSSPPSEGALGRIGACDPGFVRLCVRVALARAMRCLEADGVPRDEAQQRAVALARAELNSDPRPAPDQPDTVRCLLCGEAGHPANLLIRSVGQIWTHEQHCHAEYTRQRHDAIDAAIQEALNTPAPFPLEWAEGFARLALEDEPCPGFGRRQWPRVHPAMATFLASPHAERAAALGWTTLELFGVHEALGVTRVEHCGALLVSNGNHVAEVTPELARYADGSAYYRKSMPSQAIPVWEFRHGA